ncbi:MULTISPECIES: phosphopantetheine-binding protein [Mycoplasmatota]|uniref:Acyl carrier protein n=1 Tax=Mycoplasma yeatsii TaxID=51365 RepID=A0ABU0NFI2_9MOLU|nr:MULTISPECIES: phosphopantetheine-binding protein [Mycoplasmatota]MDQ0568144.1 acyl carrier protein [Mycoplasma yeatsii]
MELQELIINKIKKLTKKDVHLNSKLSDLKIDSLSLAELVFEAEEELNIRIDDEKIVNIETIQDIVNLISEYKK